MVSLTAPEALPATGAAGDAAESAAFGVLVGDDSVLLFLGLGTECPAARSALRTAASSAETRERSWSLFPAGRWAPELCSSRSEGDEVIKGNGGRVLIVANVVAWPACLAGETDE